MQDRIHLRHDLALRTPPKPAAEFSFVPENFFTGEIQPGGERPPVTHTARKQVVIMSEPIAPPRMTPQMWWGAIILGCIAAIIGLFLSGQYALGTIGICWFIALLLALRGAHRENRRLARLAAADRKQRPRFTCGDISADVERQQPNL